MAKITLSDPENLSSGSAVDTIAANNDAIETAFENTLSRDGTSPNEMEADLDMNSNRILNLPAPSALQEPLRLQELEDLAGGTVNITNVTTGLANERLAKTAGYTVDNADAGKTIALGGSAFYTLTFDAASGYDADFVVMVVNEDSDRAKWISISGGTSFYLWPGQTVSVFNQNDVWHTHGRSRWKVAASTLTINTDFTDGSDTLGVADGLGTTTGAFKTVNHALSMIRDNFDLNGVYANYTTVTVLMASGSNDSTLVHYSASQAAGNFGNSFVVDLNGGTLSGGIACYYGGMAITFQNGTLANAGGHVLQVNWGASVFLGEDITLGTCVAGGGQLVIADGGRLQILNDLTISAINATGYHVLNAGGYIRTATVTLTVSNDLTLAATIYNAGGITDYTNVTWSLGGHTVTGTEYSVTANGVLFGSTNVPGTVAGATATGGQTP